MEDKDNLEKNIEDYTIKLQDNDICINNYFKEQQNLNVSSVLNVLPQYTTSIDVDINKFKTNHFKNDDFKYRTGLKI